MFGNSCTEPNKGSTRVQLLHNAKAARDARKEEKVQRQAVILLQAHIRRHQTQRRLREEVRKKFDEVMASCKHQQSFLDAVEMFHINRGLLFVYNEKTDCKRLVSMCSYISLTMDELRNLKAWYVSLGLMKRYLLLWLEHMRKIMCICLNYISSLKIQDIKQQQDAEVLLKFILKLTDCSDWKLLSGKGGGGVWSTVTQLCSKLLQNAVMNDLYPVTGQLLFQCSGNAKYSTRKTILPLALRLVMRPLVQSSYSKTYVQLFIQNVWIVPALIASAQTVSVNCAELLGNSDFVASLVAAVAVNDSGSGGLDNLGVNELLAVAGNFIETSVQCGFLRRHRVEFVQSVCWIFSLIRPVVAEPNSHHTYWHPLIGFLKQQQDSRYLDAMSSVISQFQLLWHSSALEILFPLFSHSETSTSVESSSNSKSSSKLGFVSRLKMRLNTVFHISSSATSSCQLDPARWQDLHNTCKLYELAMSTLTGLRGEIMSAISFHELLPQRLWQSLQSVGGGFSTISTIALHKDSKLHTSVCSLLTLVCQCCYHIIAILDDVEVYVQQKPFTLNDLTSLSSFLNQLVFRLLWEVPSVTDPKHSDSLESRLVNAAHTLLMVLYEKDSRRSFSSDSSHWNIKDLKASSIKSDLSRNQPRAKAVMKLVPHVLPYRERVKMLRDLVLKDKESHNLIHTNNMAPRPTYIRIHRSRFLEDAYSQLCQLSSIALKGVIRVKFVNEQGLEEAGIDQDGVFKEFLEDTIKRVFDPSLTLFKTTTDQRLYPSPNSVAQDNYRALYNFVGRMLGKAIYEGFLVDVPFADFFLTNLKGTKYSAAYSAFDELASFDSDLYKNLSYVKHYDGDVSELDLTFSVNRDFFGKVETHDLTPGGSAVTVTNENKISYIHRVAHFHMRTELRDQTNSFVRGFHSIVNPEWLGYFSPCEIQRLISGDSVEMDVEDLKKHVEYMGGFHPSHQIVRWLWDVVGKDFDACEKGLFLKFVTSCSKPPVLGFSHLNPPFSIRFVDTSDDTDGGDTVGSVLRGFFRRSTRSAATRLPTASTCFNLLKLPNYPSKAVLRDKLRQAITSASGFELS
ncbi:ubiquitin-protein ligase E3B-like [Corticium candelabrum]|uniref:ubiquitin-protein ligase E3B-like n=1 Tax=Corticium candelabrum TaxID=121492 RepID=UPI002E26A08D|nr:ubiquitin-protein ligase E3B-like [Corticium candelabrum]